MYVLTSNWPDLDDLLLSHPDQNVVQEYDKVKRSILHNLLVLSNPNNQINSIFLFGLLVVGVCGVLLRFCRKKLIPGVDSVFLQGNDQRC